MASVFLLTGRPGTGKTTIIRETLSFIKIKAGGFYTQEIREGGVRKGFKIVTLDGKEAVLSHIDFPGTYRVGKYGVNLDNLERTGILSIEKAINNCALIVIDEIGKMELLSMRFRDVVLKALESNKPVLGTIMESSDPYTDRIKKLSSVKLLTVTVSNRSLIAQSLQEEFQRTDNENLFKTTG
jgi:nucleoside-triphosphatase